MWKREEIRPTQLKRENVYQQSINYKEALLAQDKNFLAVIKLRGKEPPGEAGSTPSLKGILADDRGSLGKDGKPPTQRCRERLIA